MKMKSENENESLSVSLSVTLSVSISISLLIVISILRILVATIIVQFSIVREIPFKRIVILFVRLGW